MTLLRVDEFEILEGSRVLRQWNQAFNFVLLRLLLRLPALHETLVHQGSRSELSAVHLLLMRLSADGMSLELITLELINHFEFAIISRL